MILSRPKLLKDSVEARLNYYRSYLSICPEKLSHVYQKESLMATSGVLPKRGFLRTLIRLFGG